MQNFSKLAEKAWALNGAGLTCTRAGLYPLLEGKLPFVYTNGLCAAVCLHQWSLCRRLLSPELYSSIFLPSPENSKASTTANDMEITNYNESVELNIKDNLEAQSRRALAKVIIKHNYPFNMCKHEFFEKLRNSLNPNFKLVSRNIIRMEVILDCRITLTTDIWTSKHANIAYTCLTAHYVDENWDLKKKILAYRHIPYPHHGETLF
ncbi:hypothetical protein M9H77_17076 [Catharanthus roseus]|uniref:Uncharacterized protein n=1 Tax=Catharanthus roseus TaxID=4058 RepID=A0ACC0B3Y6_CATRO|nr:hypothetical protein M9H77_17076 [Catharanthus roseus]